MVLDESEPLITLLVFEEEMMSDVLRAYFKVSPAVQ